MTGRHWFYLAVLLGNSAGIYPAWTAGSPFALVFAFNAGWALCRLLYLTDETDGGSGLRPPS
jgi:hypothetical protein